MKEVLAIAALAATLGAAQPALAQGGHGARMLERLDRDGDRAISREEARAMSDERFGRWDRDGDGAVTEAEMVAAAQERIAERVAKMFARMDGNGDGRIERAELDAAGDARFERMDADDDGSVSFQEIRARWQKWRHGTDGEARPEN